MDTQRLEIRFDDAEETAPSTAAESAAYERIHELSRAVDYDPDKVVEIMTANPRIANRMLRTANSLSLGIKHQIKSVRHAVLLVGSRGIGEFCRPILNRFERMDTAHLVDRETSR